MTAVPSTTQYVPSRSVFQVSADEAVLGLPDVETSLLTLARELESLQTSREP